MESSFGNWVKRRRKLLDLTQEGLARQVGCSSSAIYKIEADERRPSRQVAELLAAHLEIPVDQRALFLKVARLEKGISSLDSIAPLPGIDAPAQLSKQLQNNLPVFASQFVGREHEIETVSNLLKDPACRLLTLTGLGGVGKTRLSVEVARKLENDFAEGIFLLNMGNVSQPDTIITAIGDGVGVIFSGPAEHKLQVIQALRSKHALLVLDNMEHLISGSGVLGDILQQAPGVKMLLTSREQVNLRWEWIFEVHGLPVPDEASSSMFESNSAVILFLQRARQVSLHLAITPQDAAALVRICQLVDGMPLALELAASWARVLSLSEIAREVDCCLDVLETTLQDMPTRHRSMKVVFDHSWKMLTQEESAALMKLAVFPSGFRRDAAETVSGASRSLLSALVRKSLLRFGKQEGRYDFHELIRQFALERLHEHPEEEAQALELFSQYYASWLSEMEMVLKSAQQMPASSQLRDEMANWTAAWRWASEHSKLFFLRQMAPSLYWYYEIRDDFAPAAAAYQRTIEQLRSAGAPDSLGTDKERMIFAYLLSQLPWFQFRIGNMEAAATQYSESLELADRYGDLSDTADQEAVFHIQINWAYMTLLGGDIDQAEDLTNKSLAIAQAMGSQWHLALAFTFLGILALQRGHLSDAVRQLQDSLTHWRKVGEPRGLMFCMIYLGTAHLASGSVEAAESVLLESNARARDRMDRWGQAFCLDLLGQVSLAQAKPEAGVERFRDSLALSQEIGDGWAANQTLVHLGEAQVAQGNHEGAKHSYREAYIHAQQAKFTPTVFEALTALLAMDDELPPETRLGIALSIQSQSNVPQKIRPRLEQLCDRLMSGLTSHQIQTAQALAANVSLDRWEQDILRAAPGLIP